MRSCRFSVFAGRACALLSVAAIAAGPLVAQGESTTASDLAEGLSGQLRAYFEQPRADGPERAAVLRLARQNEDLLVDVLRSKRFVARSQAATEQHGRIVDGRFVPYAQGESREDDAVAGGEADRPGGGGRGDNDAMVYGPATAGSDALYPLVVYVPDTTGASRYAGELRSEGVEAGRFVMVVPDSEGDNLWRACPEQTARHVGPLRDLLLEFPIDPDRVYLFGAGRGGHAAWDVGLMRSQHWAGIYPCNGGLIHEGGYALTGGVFVENARDLAVFTVYNTTIDLGIESCRYAASLLEQWGTRFERIEEEQVRGMGVGDAMDKLDGVRRRAHPRVLTKRFNRLADGAHYWLEATRRKHEWEPTARIRLRGEVPSDPFETRKRIWDYVQEQCARMHAHVAGNEIRIEVQGVQQLRVWLDPEVVDFERDVTIVCNGDAQRPVRPKRRLDVMLEQVHRTGDTERLYFDYVDVRVPGQ